MKRCCSVIKFQYKSVNISNIIAQGMKMKILSRFSKYARKQINKFKLTISYRVKTTIMIDLA